MDSADCKKLLTVQYPQIFEEQERVTVKAYRPGKLVPIKQILRQMQFADTLVMKFFLDDDDLISVQCRPNI